MPWLYILAFILSCLVLVRSGVWVVRALTRISQYLGWREFIVAFVLMAFATTIPEFFVGITSALHGKPELSFGNVIGSNIINLTLVVAIAAFLARGLRLEAAITQRSSIYTAIIAFLPIILILDGALSRVDGVVLLLALFFYFHQLLAEEEKFRKVYRNTFNRQWRRFKWFLQDLGVFLLGVSLLLLAAEGVVWSASYLAEMIGLPLILIGILIVALGTNLPEIIFSVKAVGASHKEMVLGDLMGAVAVNSTLVLGVTCLIYPLEIFNFSPYLTGIIFTVAAVLFFTILCRTGREISRKEALFLLGLYIVFVLAEILVNPAPFSG